MDSSVYEQVSTRKQGSVKAYNGEVGYHPFFVFWAEARELVFSHLRRGSAYTSSKFELCLKAALKSLPVDVPKKLRADSGLYDREVVAFCDARHITFGITADQTAPLLAAINSPAGNGLDWFDAVRRGPSGRVALSTRAMAAPLSLGREA